MAIPLRKPNEIEKLRNANIIVAKTLNFLSKSVKAGMTLKEVDTMGEKFLRDLGARPSFKGLYGFPAAICTSLNEVIIHGIPTDIVLKEGDILGLDIGTEIDGWYGDSAIVSRGYQPLVRFCGHGIGRKPHEEPEIPNYLENGNAKSGPKIKNGMVFCIEPMICSKNRNPVILENGWDVVSADGLRGSHYEHTVAVINGKAVILSNSED